MLAKQARCSERALYAGFQEHRNATPMSVLRDVRLDRAHFDIQRGAGSVTQCAFEWGFFNLGRFAKLYFERFGERPSQTTPCLS